MMLQVVLAEVARQTPPRSAVMRLKIQIFVEEVSGDEPREEVRRRLPAPRQRPRDENVDGADRDALAQLHVEALKRVRVGVVTQVRQVAGQVEALGFRLAVQDPAV